MRKQRRCCPAYFALVAQRTERRSTKPEVAGSNPAWRARQVAATPASLQRAGGHLRDGRQGRHYPPADDDGDRTIANRKPTLRFIRAAPSRSRPAIMEEWPSGSRHRLGKAASRQLLRGFESRFLRQWYPASPGSRDASASRKLGTGPASAGARQGVLPRDTGEPCAHPGPATQTVRGKCQPMRAGRGQEE